MASLQQWRIPCVEGDAPPAAQPYLVACPPGTSSVGCLGAFSASCSLSLGSCKMVLLLADLSLAQGQDGI